MKVQLGLAALVSVLTRGPCFAETYNDPAIQVLLGPVVANRASGDLADSGLSKRVQYLKAALVQRLARRQEKPVSVQLVIADIEPNLPAGAKSASVRLMNSSYGLGGAAVTGDVVLADGRHLPVRYRYFPIQAHQWNVGRWRDADQAFDNLAWLIGDGRVPNDPNAWPAPNRFGRPLLGTNIPDGF